MGDHDFDLLRRVFVDTYRRARAAEDDVLLAAVTALLAALSTGQKLRRD